MPPSTQSIEEDILLMDIDLTLIAAKKIIKECNLDTKNLSKETFQIPDINIDYYAINRQFMAQIIQALLNKNKRIGFITAGRYTQNSIEDFFTNLFQLQEPIKNCVFIGRDDYGNVDTLKGIKIKLAQLDGKLPQDPKKICLLEDDLINYQNCINLGFNAILATGCPRNTIANNYYLAALINHYELDIHLPDEYALLSPPNINTPLLLHKYPTTQQYLDRDYNTNFSTPSSNTIQVNADKECGCGLLGCLFCVKYCCLAIICPPCNRYS